MKVLWTVHTKTQDKQLYYEKQSTTIELKRYLVYEDENKGQKLNVISLQVSIDFSGTMDMACKEL